MGMWTAYLISNEVFARIYIERKGMHLWEKETEICQAEECESIVFLLMTHSSEKSPPSRILFNSYRSICSILLFILKSMKEKNMNWLFEQNWLLNALEIIQPPLTSLYANKIIIESFQSLFQLFGRWINPICKTMTSYSSEWKRLALANEVELLLSRALMKVFPSRGIQLNLSNANVSFF